MFINEQMNTPAVLAFLPAAFFWITKLEVPLALARLAGQQAGATISVMAVTLGVQLTEIGMPRIDLNVILASAVRLVGGSLLSIALAIPFDLIGLERSAGILQASMPPAVLTTIIAMEHDLVPEFVTTALLFGTLASLLSLTVILSLA